MNIINIEHISKLFGDKLIFDDASFGLQEGDKVGIVGINGTGKSTLLRMVAGEETPDSGQIIRQNNLKMAYLPQTPEFPKDATVLSYALSGDEEDWQVQSNLVQLGITEYDAKLDTLSGGQRRKVALAKVLASDFDVLILDEPTNHLDIVSKEILENALKDYTGTVLYVSHDRYFINQTATRILELTGQTLVNYIGNYDYYLEKKEELTRIYAPAADAAAPEETAAPSEASSTKLDWKAQKEEQARLRKKENELKKTEKRIEELETRDSEIDEEMSKPEVATNVAECVKLSKEKAEIAAELEELYEKWEELAE